MTQERKTLPTTANPRPEALPDRPATFSRTNSRGLIEVVNIHTGQILCVQTSYEDLLESKWDRLVEIDTPQGKVYIEKGLNPDMVPLLRSMPYSIVIADLICEHIATKGGTIISACKELNVNYSTVLAWKRHHEEFRVNLEHATRDSALHHQHEVLDAARTRADTKTKIDALKWAAEKADPEKFGTKTKIIGDKNAPISFVLDTGIRRVGDPGFAPPSEGSEQGLGEPVHEERVAEEIPEWSGAGVKDE